jgi:hypothetical protein
VALATVEAILWPQWSDSLVGLLQALAMAALTSGLTIRAIALGIGWHRHKRHRLPWLEILVAAFLIQIFWRTGLTSFYAWRLSWELSDTEALCLFAMLITVVGRFWRQKRGPLGMEYPAESTVS